MKIMRHASALALIGLTAGLVWPAYGQPEEIADTMGLEPTEDAVVLFAGENLDAWTIQGQDAAPNWIIEDGQAQVQGGSITTKDHFSSCYLHLEFMCPNQDGNDWQMKGNSGVYFQGSYEVQVLDSYGVEELQQGDCGGIYSVSIPRVNACRPPEEWQTYDIEFRAPEYDEDGNLAKQAHFVTVYLNGVLIQADVDVPGPTTAAMEREDLSQLGPIMLQDHGCPVSYRNIWLVPTDEE